MQGLSVLAWPLAPREIELLYDAYEMQKSWLSGASLMANMGAEWLQNPANPLGKTGFGPMIASGLDVFAHASQPRGKPDFGFKPPVVEGKAVTVFEEIVLRKPFGQLKRFRKEGIE